MIILIDEKICLAVQNTALILNNQKSEEVKYVTGDLILNDSSYSILQTETNDIKISFEAILNNEIYPLKYEIVLPKNCIKQDYIIINIFNLKNKNFRKKYSKLVKNGKEYYSVIETPTFIKFE